MRKQLDGCLNTYAKVAFRLFRLRHCYEIESNRHSIYKRERNSHYLQKKTNQSSRKTIAEGNLTIYSQIKCKEIDLNVEYMK